MLFRSDGYSVSFGNTVVISKRKNSICHGTLEGNLYIIDPKSLTMQYRVMNSSTSNAYKRKEPSQLNQIYLWHFRLGHVNLRRIQRLVNDEPLRSLQVETFPLCESSLEGIMTKR